MSDFPQNFEPLLDSEQAAALVRIHPKTLQRYARSGLVSGLRVGKLWRFRASDLVPLRSKEDHLDAVARAR
jgi:excisionase family DNA binding protein